MSTGPTLETKRPHDGRLDWPAANQLHLVTELERVRRSLEAHMAHTGPDRLGEADRGLSRCLPGEEAGGPAEASIEPPPMLDQIRSVFGLSRFECDVLILCAGVEMDSAIRQLCAEANGDQRRSYATFSLALAALSDPHWTAVSPNGPLRYWRFVELEGTSPTMSPLAIDERLLHQLAGVPHLDLRVASRIEPVGGDYGDPVASHEAIARRLASLWSGRRSDDPWCVHLYGDGSEERRAIATHAAGRLGMPLYRMAAADIPASAEDRSALARLWERESLLGGGILLVEAPHNGARGALPDLAPFLLQIRSPVVLGAATPLALAPEGSVRLRVPPPSWAELRAQWHGALGSDPLDDGVDGAIADAVIQFRLSGGAVRAVAAGLGPAQEGNLGARALWDACRVQARPSIDHLAQRIDPSASWQDLVLPKPQMKALEDIAVHFRHRATVHESWGWREKSSRGLGICALFSGPSGTGKTLAAEVLAGNLRVDLYRIDLSAVVSKYIGETEKNLQQIFDAAERGGVVLLFDEADALFGKRSEVKDSHDRYANIEIGYLLQRMEAYRGLAILTTNMRSALDSSFLRRLRFVVEFPFPDASAREEIWKQVFPPRTPTNGLDPSRLARLNVAGGNIRNIALHASFLAAERGEAVGMQQVVRAAQGEYSRLDRSISGGELRGLGFAGGGIRIVSQPNIQLRIENIVIEGVSRREAERVVRATKEGLERLLTERGLPEALARDESDLRADPSPVRIEASRDSEQMGSRISAAVHQAIRP